MLTSHSTDSHKLSSTRLAIREELSHIYERSQSGLTLRDLAARFFRQKRVLLFSFPILLVIMASVSGVFTPTYRAQMAILVTHNRVEPVVSSQPSATQFLQSQVTDSELNSEVELLSSQDLLRKVVVANRLYEQRPSWLSRLSDSSEDLRIANAVRRLSKALRVDPLKKSDMISVTYDSSDRRQAALVLNSLGRIYVEKHVEAHHSDGQLAFFDQEAERLRKSLGDAESRLSGFTSERGVVSAQYERDLALQRASELEASLAHTKAEAADTQKRIEGLEEQLASIPTRLTTQLKKSDNPQLLQQMKSTLLTLQLRRSELLSKFEPSYPPVVEVEKEISNTRIAIEGEKAAPVLDETTDRNPTYEWAMSELAKSRTALRGIRARESAEAAALGLDRINTQKLQQDTIVQQNLLRTAKTEEDNYLLYLRKEEEARISDALDKRGIVNVSIVDPPNTPALPARSLSYGILLCVLIAGAGSLGSAFATDCMNPSFRTPDEIHKTLQLPILASILKVE